MSNFNQNNQVKPIGDGSILEVRTSFENYIIRIVPCDGFGKFCGDYSCMKISIISKDDKLLLDDSHVPLSVLSHWVLQIEKLRQKNKEDQVY